MKVKQTVAAVCLAAIVATSIGASAGGVYGGWQTRTPRLEEGGPNAWDHGLDNKYTVHSYYLSPSSEKSAAMVFYNECGVLVDWKINAQAKAKATADKKISYHEEFWWPEYKG